MENLKLILEIIDLLCTPLLVLIAFWGLGQIKEARNQVTEAKESRKINSKRESYKISAEKCEFYVTVIIPLQNKLHYEILEKEITFFENSQVIITADKIEVKPDYRDDDEFEAVWNLSTLEVFNAMESFAVFFTSGVADEQIGYLTVGQSFCFTIKHYLPHLIDFTEDGQYSNTIELFKIWNSRIEKSKLEKEKERLESEITKTKSMSIKAIGVD